MAIVLSNEKITKDIYIITVQGVHKASAGQFYMLRAWSDYPLLSRPISVFDRGDNYISFLYQVKGKGTSLFSDLKSGDELDLQGPYGNGFELEETEEVALVGGGIGIAPLYYTAKEIKRINPNTHLTIYLGYSEKEYLIKQFKEIADKLKYQVGGKITDIVQFENHKTIITCGPEIMMRAVTMLAKEHDTKVIVSVERRMACGIGACLGCNIKTRDGNKKVCKDGPVFLGEDIFYE